MFEGRSSSNYPKILVHHISLGSIIVRVWIDITIKSDELILWKPPTNITCIENVLVS